MARNPEQQKIYNKERYIGRKAAKMAQDYVLQLLKQQLHIRNQGDPKKNIKPILEATKVRAKMGNYRLLGLNFTSSKIGFILHYGHVGTRGASTVILEAQRYHKNATQRKATQVDLPAKEFYNNIYAKSGALDYLVKALAETRIDAIKATVNSLVVQLNTQENGR